MIATKLICIDGISGSGKSTTSQRLWLHLLKNGVDARWFYEHGPDSPIWRGAERFRLTESGITDPKIVHELVVSRWQAFAAELGAGDTIAVMESSLLQSTAGVMLAMDFELGAILACLEEVNRAIAAIRPVSIYLFANDVGRVLRAVCDERRHDQFEAPLLDLLSRTRYAKAHGLAGFDGAMRFFRRCREITDLAFSRLEIPKLAIEYSARDWRSYERQIMSGLIERPARFVGRYKDPSSDAELVVAADEKGLYLDDARWTRLMHDGGNVFHVNAVWLEMSFENESEGAFQRIALKGHLPDLAPVWIRV
jgi:thymidylate kinase